MNTHFPKTFFLFAAFFLLPFSAYAAPSVSSASGAASNGNNITISGSGFGANGPNTVVFDDFKGGTEGNTVSTSAKVGAWQDVNNPTNITYVNDATRGMVMKSVGPGLESGDYGQLGLNLTPTTDFFLSYWATVPLGRLWPGENSTDHINWKQFWMLGNLDDGHGGTANDDKIAVLLGISPFGESDRSYFLSGNDAPRNWYPGVTIEKGLWTRYSFWVKGATDATGQVWIQGLDNTDGVTVTTWDDVQTFKDSHVDVMGDANPDIQYEAFTIPGYYRTGSNIETRYSDVYLATGANAQARVEIGDAPTYATCKNLALATVNSWSDSSVSAKVWQGNFTNGPAYLYVTDASGNTNASGFPITLGSGSSDTTAPSAPSGLSVQ